MNSRAQVSLEYLIILAAFFAVLAVTLPAAASATNQFFGASDAMLAKSISQQVQEQENLFHFLGDGSAVTLEFVPAKLVSIYSEGNELVIIGGEKEFRSTLKSPQLIPRQDFSSKFFVALKKVGGFTTITATGTAPQLN